MRRLSSRAVKRLGSRAVEQLGGRAVKRLGSEAAVGQLSSRAKGAVMRVSSYRELEVYRAAFTLQQEIFECSKMFPKEETYSLTDQVRRSSRSVGACLAEAWGKRRYVAHFTSKLTDADSENRETRHWLDTAESCGYRSDQEYQQLARSNESIGRQLGKMIQNADSFCTT